MNEWDEIRVTRNAKRVLREKRVDLQRAWSETSFQMQAMRDNPELRAAGIRPHPRRHRPGLSPKLTFDPQEDFARRQDVSGRPRVAILREQGVNGHYEMAAAFDRAGFAAVDVHMSDILAGRVSLADFKGLVACGGFSYGDVLGAGQGWAQPSCSTTAAATSSRPSSRAGHLRARRLQRLPDDERAEVHHPRRRRTGRASSATRSSSSRRVS
jgi:phosphoribosylformylglycinamidine synthase